MITAVPQREDMSLSELLRDGLFVDGDWVESKDQDPEGEVRLIQLADVGDGSFRNRSSRFLTLEKAKELQCTFLEPGDILVARMPEPLGRACIFPGVGCPTVTVVDVCIIRPDAKKAKSEWLVKAINSLDFRSAMQQFVRGTTRQRISRKNLGTLHLVVPDINTQSSVAGAIDRLQAKRESSAAHVQASKYAIARFRQAVLAAACSGHLTADWRDNYEPQAGFSILEIARQRRQERLGRRFQEPEPNPHGNISNLPQKWQAVPLGLLLEEIKYGTSKRSEYGVSGIPVLRIPNVSGQHLDVTDLKFANLSEQEVESLILESDDLLMIRSNGSVELLGKTVIVSNEAIGMAYAGYLMRLRSDC